MKPTFQVLTKTVTEPPRTEWHNPEPDLLYSIDYPERRVMKIIGLASVDPS